MSYDVAHAAFTGPGCCGTLRPEVRHLWNQRDLPLLNERRATLHRYLKWEGPLTTCAASMSNGMASLSIRKTLVFVNPAAKAPHTHQCAHAAINVVRQHGTAAQQCYVSQLALHTSLCAL